MLSRKETTQIKGFAVILLVMHHSLAFIKRQPNGYHLKPLISLQINGLSFFEQLGHFGKICVPLFLFLGGYGLFASKFKKEGGEVSILHGFSKTTVRLFTSLWKVFVFFIPIGLLFFHAPGAYCEEEYIYQAFSDRSAYAFFSNFFSWSTTYNGEWWFFKYYLFCVFLGYVFLELFKRKKNFYTEIFAVIVWSILVGHIFPFIRAHIGTQEFLGNPLFDQLFAYNTETYWNSSMLFMGIVFAKYNVFTTWKNLLKERMFLEKKLLSLLGMVSVFILRIIVLKYGLDLILVPLFAFCVIVFLEDFKWLVRCFGFIGKHSTNIWLVHTFYCYYFITTAKIVYATRNAFFSLLTLMVMCILTSMFLEFFWKCAGKGYNYIRIKASTASLEKNEADAPQKPE